MKFYSFYDASTGLLTGRAFGCDEADARRAAAALSAHTPAGCQAISGRHDYLSQRVDLETGVVVDYQPPQPSSDHVWDAQAKRWTLDPAVVARQQRSAGARARIAALETVSLRAVRELLLEIAPDGAGRKRLEAIEAQIAEQRAQLA